MKKNTSERTERAALYGLLTALAMVLGFVESPIPIPFPVPGIRLGLANLVTVAGLYLVGDPGNGGGDGAPHRSHGPFLWKSVQYGLWPFGKPSKPAGHGGSEKRQWFSPVGISILGGIAHNVGQVSFAAFIVRTAGVFYYLPALLAAGCAAGAVIGVVGGILADRISQFMKNRN